MLMSCKCCTNPAIWTCFLPERTWVCKNNPSQFVWLDAAAQWLCLPLRISDGGGGELNSHWFNKLIMGRRNENVKWEVWDQIRTGEVNVALWGQRDRPVALCISDRGEQWDITHPENTAQKVRGAHEYISVCPTVGLSLQLSAHSHAWLQVAAFVKMCLDRLRPRENGSPSSCTGGCSMVMDLREITKMQSKEQIKVYMSETDRADSREPAFGRLNVWAAGLRSGDHRSRSQSKKAFLNKEIFD